MKKQLGPQPFVFPMPALLVGTFSKDGTPNAMTAAWTAVCCHKPICVGVAVRKNRLTYQNIERTGAFTLNMPSASQAKEVDYLGMVSGAKEPDKLATAGIESKTGDKVDAPILVNCPVNLECKLVGRMDLGSHTWFAGEVLEVHGDARIVKEDGTLDMEAFDPIVYVTSVSEYRALGQTVGKAYSIGKTIKQG